LKLTSSKLLSFSLFLIVLSATGWHFYQTGKKAPASIFTNTELEKIYSMSISHLPKQAIDPSNQYLGNPKAIKLGKQLFSEKRLSKNGKVACASCHQEEHYFTDGKAIASGVSKGRRNAPSLIGTSNYDWFFWDGRKDSLWSQALAPLEDKTEHALTRLEVVRFVATNSDYHQQYTEIFGQLPGREIFNNWPEKASPAGNIKELSAWKKIPKTQRQIINQIYANIGKAIAAYESTLQFKKSRFDQFIEQLKNRQAANALTRTEIAGLKLFLGQKATCNNCHSGPLLSNQQFQNIGTAIPRKDNGRADIIDQIKWDDFNCAGKYSDASTEQCQKLVYMNRNKHYLSGTYKVPTLRNISHTAPYSHDGRFKTLEEVVQYYTKPESKEMTGHHLADINLNQEEQKQLVSFLKTL
jgi:cytochrome c peroxidase